MVIIDSRRTAQISQKQGDRNICAIIKTMYAPGYHRNGFVATHALGHMMFGCHKAFKVITRKDIVFMIVYTLYIYIYIYISIYI